MQDHAERRSYGRLPEGEAVFFVVRRRGGGVWGAAVGMEGGGGWGGCGAGGRWA